MVQTPVGARCRSCAKVHRLPVYDISASYYLRAAGVALAMAAVVGSFWALFSFFIALYVPLSLNLFVAPLAGYLVGESVSRAVNRKRGTILAVIGGIGAAGSYLVSVLVPWGTGSLFGVLNLFAIAAVALAVYMAVVRLR